RPGIALGAFPRRAGQPRRRRDPAGPRSDERRVRAQVRISLRGVRCRSPEGRAPARVSGTPSSRTRGRARDGDRGVPRDHARAAEYAGSTLLGRWAFLGRRFIETYPVMEGLRVSAREVPLDAAAGERGPSEVLFRSTRGDRAVAQVAVSAAGGKSEITAARSGWEGMRFVKTTGSSFATFARDDYTTLPELTDRPLTIRMDV